MTVIRCLTWVWVFCNAQAGAKLRVSKAHRFEKCLRAAEVDSESLSVALSRLDELKTARVSLIMGTGQEKAACDTLPAPTHKLEVAAATGNEELALWIRLSSR